MCAGAAVSTVNLIIVLAVIVDIRAGHAIVGRRLIAAQVSQVTTPVIAQVIVSCLVPVAVWLWMARANGRGRNWASSAFFRSQGSLQARHRAQRAELERLRSSRARWPHQV
jgi:hypothetical protein